MTIAAKLSRRNLVLLGMLTPCVVAAVAAITETWSVFGVAVAVALAIAITLIDLVWRSGGALRFESSRASASQLKAIDGLARKALPAVERATAAAKRSVTVAEKAAPAIEQAAFRGSRHGNDVVRQTVLDRFDHLGRKLDVDLHLTRQYVVSEVDALDKVRERFPLGPDRPVLASWAMTPRSILQLTELIAARRPSVIVECGSGSSTVYASAVLRDLGLGGKVIAMEHLPAVVDAVNAQLGALGLADHGEVRHAPLVPFDGADDAAVWYDLAAVGDVGPIDMLVVDGPPASTGRLARLPAVPLLRNRFASRGVVVLDDADRADERQVVRQWLADPTLERVHSDTRDHAILTWDETVPDQ